MTRRQSIFAAAAAGFLTASAALPAFAGSSFDGAWRISASAETPDGRCKDRAVSLRVEDGNIRYAGLLSAFVSGTVDKKGRLLARIARIHVRGQMIQGSGSGDWQSPHCAGTWTALRE